MQARLGYCCGSRIVALIRRCVAVCDQYAGPRSGRQYRPLDTRGPSVDRLFSQYSRSSATVYRCCQLVCKGDVACCGVGISGGLSPISIDLIRMAASGRKQPLKTAGNYQTERPLLRKADIPLLIPWRNTPLPPKVILTLESALEPSNCPRPFAA
jgi:hypothetical protein